MVASSGGDTGSLTGSDDPWPFAPREPFLLIEQGSSECSLVARERVRLVNAGDVTCQVEIHVGDWGGAAPASS